MDELEKFVDEAGEMLERIVRGLTSVGGILLIGLGINILEIKKIRVINMLPALLIVTLLLWWFA